MSDLFQTDNFSSTTNASDVAVLPSVSDDFLSIKLKAKEVLEQINWVSTHRKTEYLPEILALFTHKSVAVRRKIAEIIPFIGTKKTIVDLEEWKKNESDRQTWLLIETCIDKLQRGNNTATQLAQVLTVSEAITYLKKMVSEKTFIIEGELSEVRLFQRSFQDIYYLGLKDKQDGRIDCMLLSSVAYRAGFPINDGMMVRITGKFKLGKQSKLYFEIQHIELTGEGELLRNLKLLEDKLRNEGLFDELRKRKIPTIPKKVLLIASPNSAAIKDFTNVLSSRRGGMEIFLLPIKTQGVGAEFEIVRALQQTNELCDQHNIDTVVMTRGGGSQDDLFVFNSEHIVRALFQVKRPTIVAIGHERDVTLSELVADLRCSTPSQAAEKVSLSQYEITASASATFNYILNHIQLRTNQYESANGKLFFNISYLVQQRLGEARNLCRQTNSLIIQLIHNVRATSQSAVIIIQNIVEKTLLNYNIFIRSYPEFSQHINYSIQKNKQINQFAFEQIKHKVEQKLQTTQHEFSMTYQHIQLKDPQRVLEQGYVLVRQNNDIVTQASKLHPQTVFSLRFVDGEVEIKAK